MTDNTRKLLDAAAAVLGLPPGLPPIGERRRSQDGVRKSCGYRVTRNGEVWVMYCDEAEHGGNGSARLDAWLEMPLADAQPVSAPDALPRVVEWADLRPGDLALDIGGGLQGGHVPLVRVGHGPLDALPLTWRASDGTSKTWDELDTTCESSQDRVVLIARNVPKRASAIRAAYEAMRERALEVGKSIPRRGA